jgi:hypothetical protein
MKVANITNILQNPTKISNLRIVNNPGYSDFNTNNKAIDILKEEGGESFYNYIGWLGLAKEPDLVVLSSKHHYYYDPEEMHNTRTVINVKELNQIKQIKPFLNSCLNFLPEESNFIGCFIDNEKINGYELRNLSNSYSDKKNDDDLENGIVSRFPFINMLYSLVDSKTNRYMSKKSITLLLKEYDFKIMDMTECRGFTFFHSRKFHDYN